MMSGISLMAGMGWPGLLLLLLLWGSTFALILWGVSSLFPTRQVTTNSDANLTHRGTLMSRTVHPRRSPGAPTLVLIAIPVVVIVLAVAFAAAQPQMRNPPPEQAAVPHFVDVKAPGEPRTVVIGGMTDTLPGTSNEAGYLMTNLRAGQIPAGATQALVLTDTNCAPDADGVSHCLNDLQIGNVVVTVQHHHQMAQVPCLSPGETVTLMPFANYQRQL